MIHYVGDCQNEFIFIYNHLKIKQHSEVNLYVEIFYCHNEEEQKKNFNLENVLVK
jgi:hypothetical protein